MREKNTFWIRVKALMEARNITLGILGLLLDVRPKILRKWMLRNVVPDDLFAYRISNVFGVSRKYLFHGIISKTDNFRFSGADDAA